MTTPGDAATSATAAATAPAARRWRDALTFSIKGRLVLLFVLLSLATSAVFLLGMRQLLRNGWLGYAAPLVTDYADRLAADLGSPPDEARARALTQRLPITISVEGTQVQFEAPPGGTRHEHRGRLGEPGRRGGHDGRGMPHDADDQALGDAAEPGSAGWGMVRRSADGHRIVFGLARPPDHLRPRLFGWATLALLLALTALAYAYVRRLLEPLDGIGAGVEAYGRGEFDRPIAVQRADELGALATRINGMASNLHGILEAKRALLLAISHELRSPLTRARVNVELLDDGAPRQALLHDLAEMRDLIDNLLESERLAQGHAALQAEAVDLSALVRELVAAQFDGNDLLLELDDIGAAVQADPTRLRLLLRNLLDNALRHGAAATTPPSVFLRTEADGRLALGVRDRGSGVTPAQRARLSEAFYRPDSARTRAAGGVGLGLTLCRLVAQAHGGELRIRDAAPGLEVIAVWSPVWSPTNPPN